MKFSIIFLALFLILGCSQKQIVENVELKYIKIPNELLEFEELKKPVVKSEIDIINAYSALFLAYKELEIKIKKIKLLNEKN